MPNDDAPRPQLVPTGSLTPEEIERALKSPNHSFLKNIITRLISVTVRHTEAIEEKIKTWIFQLRQQQQTEALEKSDNRRGHLRHIPRPENKPHPAYQPQWINQTDALCQQMLVEWKNFVRALRYAENAFMKQAFDTLLVLQPNATAEQRLAMVDIIGHINTQAQEVTYNVYANYLGLKPKAGESALATIIRNPQPLPPQAIPELRMQARNNLLARLQEQYAALQGNTLATDPHLMALGNTVHAVDSGMMNVDDYLNSILSATQTLAHNYQPLHENNPDPYRHATAPFLSAALPVAREIPQATPVAEAPRDLPRAFAVPTPSAPPTPKG